MKIAEIDTDDLPIWMCAVVDTVSENCKKRLKTSCAEHRVTYCPLKQKEETCIPHSPYISVWFSLPRLCANHSVLCEQ